MGTAQHPFVVPDPAAHISRLEQRIADQNRALLKANAKARGWQAEAERQRKRADEADANSRRFHALLIQERVLKTKRQGEAA